MLPDVNGVQSLQAIRHALASREATASADTARAAEAPSGAFAGALDRLVDMQAESDRAIEKLIAGEQVDLHQVMLSVEKTDLSFRIAMQLRNKLVQAYQEIMRMQV